MKKSRISFQFILGFLLLAFLVAGGCSKSTNDPIPSYTISGQVTGDVSEGVEIYLSGSASATSTTTDEDGNYSFTVHNGTYTVIPVLFGYTFTDVSMAVTVNGANVPDKNFTATANVAPTYSISGQVTGAVQAGVTITLSGDAVGTYTTLADGSYIFANLPAGTYTVIPSLTGYTFNPSSLTPTIAAADITGQDFVAIVVFSQADLVETTWKVQGLASNLGWFRFTATVDKDGFVIASDCDEGGLPCPPDGSMQLIIDPNGVISQEGSETLQGRMTLTKNFIVTTAEGDFWVAQKMETPASPYVNTDVWGKSFVINQAYTSGDPWAYGEGYIEADGNMVINTFISPTQSMGPFAVGAKLSVDSEGNVYMQPEGSDPMLLGFLSADKKTVVTVMTSAENEYLFQIIQLTGPSTGPPEPTYTSGPLPAGTYDSHFFGFADSSFWAHSLFKVDNLGERSLLYWVPTPTDSIPEFTMDDYIYVIDWLGTVKIPGAPTYRGQMSGDGMFIVHTQIYTKDDVDFYSFGIDILTNGAVPAEAE